MGFIRFLLATSVLIGHSGPLLGFSLMDPYEAVRFFFVISGFYMGMVLDEKYQKSTALFLKNRFMRIMPGYWVTVVLTLASFALLQRTYYFSSLEEVFFHVKEMNFGTLLSLIFSNLFLVGQDFIFLLGINDSGQFYFSKIILEAKIGGYHFLLVPQAWSVSNEFLFYIFAPFLIRRNSFFLLLIGLLSYFSANPILERGFGSDPWVYRNAICSLYYFILGIASFRIYKYVRKLNSNAFYMSVIFMMASSLFIIFYSKIDFQLIKDVAPIIFSITIPFIFNLTKSSTTDRLMGEFSYPMYILHYLVMFWVGHEAPGAQVLVITLLLSAAMIFLIERPIFKLRQR